MAVQFTTASARRSARAGRQRPPISEINVTPLVDVMLVLLVVFMITAPLLTAGVEVDLPEAAVSDLAGMDEPVEVTITASGEIWLGETPVELDQLGPRLAIISDNNPDVRVFIRGDRMVAYEEVMAVMGALTEAGFRRLALEARRFEGDS